VKEARHEKGIPRQKFPDKTTTTHSFRGEENSSEAAIARPTTAKGRTGRGRGRGRRTGRPRGRREGSLSHDRPFSCLFVEERSIREEERACRRLASGGGVAKSTRASVVAGDDAVAEDEFRPSVLLLRVLASR